MTAEWLRIHLSMVSIHGNSEDCLIEYRLTHPIEMNASCVPFGRITVSADDLFDALSKVRLEAEKCGYLLLCNGARKDAYPSRMSRQMGRGAKLYAFKHGVQARKEDQIDLLEPAAYNQVATVVKQRENFEAWLNSLDAAPSVTVPS